MTFVPYIIVSDPCLVYDYGFLLLGIMGLVYVIKIEITATKVLLELESLMSKTVKFRFYCATIAYHVGLNALLVAARNYDQRLRKKDIYSWP